MKCYTDPKTTPLKFHKIFHRILLPLWILGTFAGAFRLLSYADYAAYFSILTFVYLGAGAALVACFLGLGTWERYAWYNLMGVLSGMLLMRIVISFVNLQSGFSDISDFLGELIGAFASYGLILLYYYKRRGLFFQSSSKNAIPEASSFSHLDPDKFSRPFFLTGDLLADIRNVRERMDYHYKQVKTIEEMNDHGAIKESEKGAFASQLFEHLTQLQELSLIRDAISPSEGEHVKARFLNHSELENARSVHNQIHQKYLDFLDCGKSIGALGNTSDEDPRFQWLKQRESDIKSDLERLVIDLSIIYYP